MPAGSSIAVVTDSTASLPPEVAEARGIAVVPLQVVIGAEAYDEGSEDATPERVAAALREFLPVSTSRPAPAVLLDAYERAALAGAKQIVSVHISGEMSGTFESAQLAARDAPVRVVCVDSRQVGVATGYAALAAADAIGEGRSVEDAAEAAERRAAACSSLFYVDTLEYLRRGGPDRRRGGAVRRCAGGEAAAADRGRQGGVAGEGAHLRPRRWPGWRSSRSRRPTSGRSTCASPTWPTRSGPASSRNAWVSGSPIPSASARCGAASSAPYSARTWGQA